MSEEFATSFIIWKISLNEDNYFTSRTTLITFVTRYIDTSIINTDIQTVSIHVTETNNTYGIHTYQYRANTNLYVKDAIKKLDELK